MKKRFSVLLTFVGLLGVVSWTTLQAQVRFETKLSKTRLGVNERLRVTFEMNEDGDNFAPPSFEGFSVVGGPNQSVSNRWVNGVRSYSKSYSYFLTPQKQGVLTIGAASIEISGEVYTTSPQKVTVTKAVNNPNSPQALANAIADQNLHLVAELSKSDPYLNEAVTIVYKLYFSSAISVSNVNETEQPKYADFWSHMLPIPKLVIKEGTYKGERYNYVTWRKTVLYPQKTGKLVIEPLTLNVSVDVPTNRRDFFGRIVYQKTPKSITAGKRILRVRPLPEIGKPSDFTGAVGDFDFSVQFNKTALKSTESLQATVKVSGRGNLGLFNLPQLEAPSALEVYAPEHDENIKTNLLGMQGSVSDVYTIVPQYQGKYPLPALTFSYFDPVRESYVRHEAPATVVDVYEGPQPQAARPKATPRAFVNPADNYFDFIKLKTAFTPMNRAPFYGSSFFWTAVSLPGLLFLGLVLLRNRQANRPQDLRRERQRRANRLAKKYLGSAKNAMHENNLFYEALDRALHNYLKAKLAVETADIDKEKMAEMLTDKGAEATTINALIALLRKCEQARYAPVAQSQPKDDYNAALKTITLLDKEL